MTSAQDPTAGRSTLLFLLGPRGSGKTTVARLVATQLGWDWVDADAVLEDQAGRSIRQIFAEDGEAVFREWEAATLSQLCARQRTIIATGGGVVLRVDNRQILRAAGASVWLTAEARTLWQRLQGDATTAERRPNLRDGGFAEIEEVLRVREPLYRECADLVVDTTDRTPAEVARVIQSWYSPS